MTHHAAMCVTAMPNAPRVSSTRVVSIRRRARSTLARRAATFLAAQVAACSRSSADRVVARSRSSADRVVARSLSSADRAAARSLSSADRVAARSLSSASRPGWANVAMASGAAASCWASSARCRCADGRSHLGIRIPAQMATMAK